MLVVRLSVFRALAFILAAALAPLVHAQTAPIITSQPASIVLAKGSQALLSVVATGLPPPTYQWKKNGVDLAGATHPTLILASAAESDSGLYSVAVSNSGGSVTSNGVTVSVVVPASVSVTAPASAVSGQPVTFTAGVSGGTAPYTYQWFKNGYQPAQAIAGANGPVFVLTTPTVTGDHASVFTVQVTDALGVVSTSAGHSLSVSRGPQTITFDAPLNPGVGPSPISLGAKASSGLPVTYTVLSGPATLSGGAISLNAVGLVTVRASQAGDLNYTPAPTVEQSFLVGKGTPAIAWPVPAAVADGAVLGSVQLNATANVPGSFSYAPASGTVVRAPLQLLTATFTPNDTANYLPTTVQRTLPVIAPDVARLGNVSVRTTLTAAQSLVVGFSLQGGTKPVLVRAVGPGLGAFGVTGTMSDPRVSLYRDTTLLESNDNWGGTPALSSAFAAVGAFALPAASLDAAILRSLEGAHTAQVTGPAGTVLVEVYDAGSGSVPRLSNVSARNRVGPAGNVLIAGFALTGPGERRLLVRAVGPTLGTLGVGGALADPRLELFSGSVRITENDTWAAALAPTFALVGAFPLNTGSRDAALVVSLPAGNYSVQVSAADGGTGEALVELYELP